MYQVVNNLSHQAGAHALQGRRRLPLQRRSHHLSAVGSRRATAFSSLANFLAGVYNNAGFTQTFGATEVSQTNPNVGVYAQDEWKVGPRVTLNLGVRYDLQFLETIDTDTNNVSPRVGRGLVAVRLARARSSAAAPACSTTACRCARSPTRCCRRATRPTSPTCARSA